MGKKTLILKAVQKVAYCQEIKHRWLDSVDSITKPDFQTLKLFEGKHIKALTKPWSSIQKLKQLWDKSGLLEFSTELEEYLLLRVSYHGHRFLLG